MPMATPCTAAVSRPSREPRDVSRSMRAEASYVFGGRTRARSERELRVALAKTADEAANLTRYQPDLATHVDRNADGVTLTLASGVTIHGALLVAAVGLYLGSLGSGLAVILTYYGLLFLLGLPFVGLRAPALLALAGAWLMFFGTPSFLML